MPKKELKFLLVEDDPDQVLMYEIELNNRKIKFLNAKSKEKAMEIAKKEQPDIILLDMLLGDIKGMDILQELKTNKKTKDLKVLFLTNFKEKKLSDKALKAGALEYIIKSDHVPSEVIDIALSHV